MDGPTPGRDRQAMLRVLQSSSNPSDILDLIKRAGGGAKILGELGKSADGLVAHLKGLGGKGVRAPAELAPALRGDSRQSQEFVRKYVDAPVIKQLKPEEKVTLLKMLLHSPTGKADERGILRILNSAKDVNELKTLVEGAGKSLLAKEVDDVKIQK